MAGGTAARRGLPSGFVAPATSSLRLEVWKPPESATDEVRAPGSFPLPSPATGLRWISDMQAVERRRRMIGRSAPPGRRLREVVMRSLERVCESLGRVTLVLLWSVFLPPPPLLALEAHAEQETRVSLEPTGRLFEIDRVLARRLGLFLDAYPDFQSARLYQTGDDTFVLEVTVGQGDRRRIPMTPGDVEVLRRDVAERMARAAPERLVDQEGRPMLLAGAATLGLGFYGWATPAAFEAGDPNTAVGLYLLVSGGSFAIPFMATQRATVTVADADLALYGASRGIAHGVFLREALDPNHDIDTGQVLGMAMLTSMTEGAVFFGWSRSAALEPGVTRTMGTLGDYGMLSTIGIASVATPGHFPRSSMGWSALCGSAAGIAAGRAFAAGRGFSRGDAGLMRTATLVGAFTGASLGDLARGDGPDDSWIIGGVAGGALGFVAGGALVRDHDFSEGHSRMVAYGTGAGALAGLGIAFLTVEDEKPGGVITAGGAVLGYALVYRSLRNAALADAGADRPARSAPASRFSWTVDPMAAFALARPHATPNEAPLVRVRYAFGGADARP